MSYYHQGGWAEFASDLVSALAKAGEKQLDQKQATSASTAPTAQHAASVATETLNSVQAAAKKKADTMKTLMIVLALYLLSRGRV